MAYQALLFDLDGTLVETVSHWLDASVAALTEAGVDVSPAQFEEWYRKDLVLKHLLAERGIDPDAIARIRARRDALYVATLRSRTAWLPWAEETLLRIKGRLPLALVTNSHRIYVDAIGERLPLVRETFPTVVTVDDMAGKRKPHPCGLLLACDALKIPPDRCLSIGDRIMDIEASRAAGIASCLVPGPYTTEQAKEQADFVVDSLRELHRIAGV